MSRGGKRENAGRPPIIGDFAKIAIGARCEELWETEWKAASAKNVQVRTGALGKLWEEAQAVPVDQRRVWLSSQRGEDYRDDIEFGLREQQGIIEEPGEPSRVLHVKAARPKGSRRTIIERVALEESSKRGQTFSPRFVESCWKDFRKLKQRLNT